MDRGSLVVTGAGASGRVGFVIVWLYRDSRLQRRWLLCRVWLSRLSLQRVDEAVMEGLVLLAFFFLLCLVMVAVMRR